MIPHEFEKRRFGIGGLVLVLLVTIASGLFAEEKKAANDFDHRHQLLSSVLARYVTQGRVDYAGLKANRGDLDSYLACLGAVPKSTFDTFSRKEKLAFYINAYNAFTLRLVIDHYPLKSIRDIGGGGDAAWTGPFVRLENLFGKKTSLTHLENEVIRKRFKEPLVHFALVCAAKGCPPLQSRAFTAQGLASALKQATRAFLGDTEKNRYDPAAHTLYLSKIFEWYRDDFGGESALAAFFVEHGPPKPVRQMRDAVEQGQKITIAFLSYDWALNQ